MSQWWLWPFAPTSVTHSRGTPMPVSLHVCRERCSIVVPPSSFCTPQQWQWCLAFPVGPGLLLCSLGCRAPVAHCSLAPWFCFRIANPSPLHGLFCSPSLHAQPLPKCLRLWHPRRWYGDLCVSLLSLPQSSCCTFLWGFEFPSRSWLIFLPVRCLPVWISFVVQSSLSGVLVLAWWLFSFPLCISFYLSFYPVVWRVNYPFYGGLRSSACVQ